MTREEAIKNYEIFRECPHCTGGTLLDYLRKNIKDTQDCIYFPLPDDEWTREKHRKAMADPATPLYFEQVRYNPKKKDFDQIILHNETIDL